MNFKGIWKTTIAICLCIVITGTAFLGGEISLINASTAVKQKNTAVFTISDTEELTCTIESSVTKETRAADKIKAFVREKIYYFLLPSYLELNKTEIRVKSSAGETILFDNRSQEQLGVGDFTLGEHTLRVGEKTFQIVVKQSSRVASMFVTTDAPLSYIHESKKNKTTGAMTLVTKDGVLEYDDALSQVKARGNTTFHARKKPYQIKLANEADLLGMGKAKTWILLANAFDESGIRNKLIYDLAQGVGLASSMSGDWVDLYMNGEYYGNYLLSEKVEIAKNRVDIKNLEKESEKANPGMELSEFSEFGVREGEKGGIKGVMIPNEPADITGGYLLEVDAFSRYAEEASGFVTNRNQPVVIKSPEYVSVNQAAYILDVFQKFEDAIYAKDGRHPVTKKMYSEYFDMPSFIKRYIIDEISRNIDAGVTSSFFYKPEGEDSLVYSGPCWDYDMALGRAMGFVQWPEGLGYPNFTESNTPNWYEALYRFPEFKIGVRVIYNEIFRPVLDQMINEDIPRYIEKLKDSLEMNEVRWPLQEEHIGYGAEQKVVVEFLKKRVGWLNKTWLPASEEEMPKPTVEPTLEPTV